MKEMNEILTKHAIDQIKARMQGKYLPGEIAFGELMLNTGIITFKEYGDYVKIDCSEVSLI